MSGRPGHDPTTRGPDDRRAALLSRIAAPAPPSDPEAAAVWRSLEPSDRSRLLWAATDVVAARNLGTRVDRWVVDVLATDRARRRTMDTLTPVVTALLVLSTVWGFGRAAFPAVSTWFLIAGLLLGAVTTAVGLRRAAQRRTAARAVRAILRDP